MRAALGFLCGAVSVLTFHAGAWEVLHLNGMMPAPFPMAPTAPFGVPVIASLAFWGGVWGMLFGLVVPWMGAVTLLWGVSLGIVASLFGWAVVPLLKGLPPATGSLQVPLIVNVSWGIGVALLTLWLIPRRVDVRI